MKIHRFATIALLSTAVAALAQDDERRAPPVEIPDFSNLDEYIYEPRSTLRFGFRYISGAKTSFSGQGRVPSADDPSLSVGANLTRNYHDGSVKPDGRTVARLDSSGNPVIDPQSNSQVFDAVSPDGRTNSWNYTNASQLALPGYVAFHTYSADVVDTGVRQKESTASAGMDISTSRDMGKLFGGRIPWNLTVGVSINDIAANTADKVRASLSTLTDYYSTFGRTVPDAPYSSPSSATTNVLDGSGNAVLNADGTTQTVTTDTSILIGNEPAGRTNSTATDDTSVSNRWKVKGAYYTFRAGPTVLLPITSRLKASLSLGAALVYSGSSYTVTQTLTPSIGNDIVETGSNSAYKLLPGLYADATLQFDLTDRTGFYAGAVMQSSGSYAQSVETANLHYTTKIDLANLNGVRAGLSYRF
ncbi:MAG: hypothetical protein WCQ89_05885 [Verrucomicrobiota bacterium]|jgi:hypothetical protein